MLLLLFCVLSPLLFASLTSYLFFFLLCVFSSLARLLGLAIYSSGCCFIFWLKLRKTILTNGVLGHDGDTKREREREEIENANNFGVENTSEESLENGRKTMRHECVCVEMNATGQTSERVSEKREKTIVHGVGDCTVCNDDGKNVEMAIIGWNTLALTIKQKKMYDKNNLITESYSLFPISFWVGFVSQVSSSATM